MGVYTSQDPTYGRKFLKTVLAAYAASAGAALIASGKVRLSKDPAFLPVLDSTIADLSPGECDFTGYTAGGYDLTMTGPFNVGVGYEGEIAHVVAVGSGGPPFVGNSVYGYWIDDGTNVVMYERFQNATPLSVAVADDFVELDLRLPLPFQATL